MTAIEEQGHATSPLRNAAGRDCDGRIWFSADTRSREHGGRRQTVSTSDSPELRRPESAMMPVVRARDTAMYLLRNARSTTTADIKSRATRAFYVFLVVSPGLLTSVAPTACGTDDRTKAEATGDNLIESELSGPDNDAEIDSFDPGETDNGEFSGEGGDGAAETGGDDGGCVNPDGSNNDDDDGDEYDFSIIWIANTTEGTVSKVDTRRAVEVARYRTGPDGNESPSRTSVNLHGDVALANRGSGTVIKVAAREANCFDANQDGQIQTSQGPNDVLPWGEDECVLWSHQLDFVHQGDPESRGGPRALAWEPGGSEEDPCGFEARLWVGWRDWKDTSTDASSGSRVRRINADGSMDAEVRVDVWDGGPWGHGFYGGASDVEGNYWGIGSQGILVRVDAESLEVENFQRQGPADSRRFYGLAMDGQGNPWISTYDEHGLVMFDAARRQFVEIDPMPAQNPGAGTFRGLVVDRDYQVWIAGNGPCGLARYDIVAETWSADYDILPGCQTPVGVSVDHDGFVWVVDQGAEQAYKLDPSDNQSQLVRGFVQPYTYSDMTGSGLKLVDDQIDPPMRR